MHHMGSKVKSKLLRFIFKHKMQINWSHAKVFRFSQLPAIHHGPQQPTPDRASWQNMATKLDLLSTLSHTFHALYLPLSTPFQQRAQRWADRGLTEE